MMMMMIMLLLCRLDAIVHGGVQRQQRNGGLSVQTRRQPESSERRRLGTAARRLQSRPLQGGQVNGAESQGQCQHSNQRRHDTALFRCSHRSSKGI